MIPFKTLSQAKQDIFVYSIAGNNGTYIEIGGNKPKKINNTFNLETKCGYKGFSIEYDNKFQEHWKNSIRKNKCYFEDALEFNYEAAAKENNLKKHITYLSCDIEPPENTFSALKRIHDQGFRFDIITFEHDLYKSKENFNLRAKEFLLPLGYKVAIDNVYAKGYHDRIFETWFVAKHINFEPIEFSAWSKMYS